MPRAAMMAGALSLAVPASAGAQTQATTATVAKKRMHVRAGQRVAVAGATTPGRFTSLQIRRRGRWRTIDRDRTAAATGRYTLRGRIHRPMSVPARLKIGRAARPIGRVNVYRRAYASWYGPGLYGNRLGCGGTLRPGRIGVAHKTLRCGTRLRLRHRGRTLRVRVIDRGPYVGGREYDLTEATARKLRFRGHGTILTTR
jgi:rare lipoprotein A